MSTIPDVLPSSYNHSQKPQNTLCVILFNCEWYSLDWNTDRLRSRVDGYSYCYRWGESKTAPQLLLYGTIVRRGRFVYYLSG